MSINNRIIVLSLGLLALMYSGASFAQVLGKNGSYQLTDRWVIFPSDNTQNDGALISTRSFTSNNSYPARVPSTILGTLVADSVYKNVFVGDNLKNIPAELFKKPWWYRTSFQISADGLKRNISLEFDGINYRGNVWLNGRQIASADTFAGAFRRFILDVSPYVKENNFLAIEVFPPLPGEPSIGFADWNPDLQDCSMGLWRPVKIKISGDISLQFPYVQSKINHDADHSAALTVTAEVCNYSANAKSGVVSGKIGDILVEKHIDMRPGEKRRIVFNEDEFPQLRIKKPRIWWTYNLGKPELYTLHLKVTCDGKASDECSTKFGIREVSDYTNEQGFKGYSLNGRKIQIIGGGWVDNLFLNNDYKNIKAQVEYIKNMGLNAIRLEGFWGTNDDLYDLCDEYGILIMAGWSCQWENDEFFGRHVDDFGGIQSPEEINLIAQSWEDQLKWLRNHPSIFLWLYGSDRIPRPALEKKYIDILKDIDPTRPVLASAGEHTSAVTGPTGVKMRGPYDYVAPVYWWADKSRGGAFGFNTEVGPGVELPTKESLKKMIPAQHLWPIDSIWDFHCGKGTFNNLKTFNSVLAFRLGEPGDFDDYCRKSQFLSYEGTRAMFEAHLAHKQTATGVIHWMLNSAWPKLWWQLYDYYLNPTGAYYGTKKACEPVHILFNYGNASVMAVNNSSTAADNLTAHVEVLNIDLTKKYSEHKTISLAPDEAKEIIQLPAIADLSTTYFLNLKLMSGDKVISANLYCLSSKPDILDTDKSSWYATPCKQYADLTDLQKLGQTELSMKQKITYEKEGGIVEVEVSNKTGKLALQVVLALEQKGTRECVLPIVWDDNYFPLFPGESRIVKGHFSKTDLGDHVPVVRVSGWNLQ